MHRINDPLLLPVRMLARGRSVQSCRMDLIYHWTVTQPLSHRHLPHLLPLAGVLGISAFSLLPQSPSLGRASACHMHHFRTVLFLACNGQ